MKNFPFPSILILEKNGFEVKSIAKHYSGVSDERVMELAQKDNLLILTFDKDYGELIVRYSPKNPPAVVIFRYKGYSPEYPANELIKLINDGLQIESCFTVIDVNGIRQRKY